MAYDQLKIYKNALVTYLGEGQLASLTEDRGVRHLLDSVWAEDPINYCLEQGQWQFATKAVKLEADAGIEPDFGYRYGFTKDTDWMRTVALSADEYFNEPYTQFADENGFLYAPIDVLYAKYVSNDAAYGLNYTKWSPTFYEAVSCYMAWKVVNRIKNSKASRAELWEEMEKMFSSAQGKDGVNRPTRFPSRGGWNAARGGSRGRYREGR